MEQSYKQVKHVLGWSAYQIRSDIAIRRHWQLVCCAFSFCWWAYGRSPTEEPHEPEDDLPADAAGREKKEDLRTMAGGPEGGKGVVGAVGDAVALLEAFSDKPPPLEPKALLEQVFSGRGLYLYAR